MGTAGRGTSTHPTAFAVLAHTISIAARASMVRDDILDACGARARGVTPGGDRDPQKFPKVES